MNKLSLSKMACIVFVFCAATAIASSATTTFTSLVSFVGTNGAYPQYMSLVQGTDGNFYGTAQAGGGLVTCCFSETVSLERSFSAMSPAICCCNEMMSALLPL